MNSFLNIPEHPLQRLNRIIQRCIDDAIKYGETKLAPIIANKTVEVLHSKIKDVITFRGKQFQEYRTAVLTYDWDHFTQKEDEMIKAWKWYIDGMYHYIKTAEARLFNELFRICQTYLHNNDIFLKPPKNPTKFDRNAFTTADLYDQLGDAARDMIQKSILSLSDDVLISSEPRHYLIYYCHTPKMQRILDEHWAEMKKKKEKEEQEREERRRQRALELSRTTLISTMPDPKRPRVLQRPGKAPSFPNVSQYFAGKKH